jgi:hypothetical protein
MITQGVSGPGQNGKFLSGALGAYFDRLLHVTPSEYFGSISEKPETIYRSKKY